jgi:hypothetical protein
MAELLNMNDLITQYQLALKVNQKDAVLIELFNLENELNIDAPHVACNRGQIHEVILRDTYPEAEFHGYNMGSGSAATTFRMKTEGLCYADKYVEVNKKLADDSGDHNAYLAEAAEGVAKGMGRQKAYVSIYGDKNKDPYMTDGLFTRLKKGDHVLPFLTTDDAEATKPTSIYMIAFGKDKFHYLHSATFGNTGVKRSSPKEAHIETAPRANGRQDGKMDVYQAHLEMEFGLAIEHPDSVWRISNVPTDPAWWDKTKRERLIDLVLKVQDYMPSGTATNGLYGNIRVKQLVEKAGRELQIVNFSEKDPWGRPVNLINGMRVRRMDVIKNDELQNGVDTAA